MVKTGIFGDVHGCQEALEQVLGKLLSEYGVDRLVWNGDIVGYGPNPRECYEMAKRFTGKGTNRFLTKGNHDEYFGTGRFSRAGQFAKVSIEWAWKNWLNISDPSRLRSATQILDRRFVGGVAVEEESGEEAKSGWNWEKSNLNPRNWNYRRLWPGNWRRGRSYHDEKEVKSIIRAAAGDPEKAEAVAEFFESEKRKREVEPYLNFFEKIPYEHKLDGDSLWFAHAFPPSLREFAEELGIAPELIDTAEIYVREQSDYDEKAAKKGSKGDEALQIWESNNVPMDKLIDKLPEGTTLFLCHNHERAFLQKGNRKIIIPGAVFHRNCVEGDPNYNVAEFAVHNSESGDVTLGGVEYDRKEVDRKMREECGFGKHMGGKK